MTLMILWLFGVAAGVPVPKAPKTTGSETDCPEFNYGDCDFLQKMCEQDLQNFTFYGDFGMIDWKSKLTTGKSGARQGVLLVEPNEDVQMVKISFGLKNVKGWAFGISDLLDMEKIPEPANGEGAEIHNWEKQMILYENIPKSDFFSDDDQFLGARVPLNLVSDFFTNAETRFDVTLLKNRIVMDTKPHIKGTKVEFQDKKMFTFDYGFAVGLNRDPADPPTWAKSGTGVYGVCIKFVGQKRNSYW